MAITVRNLLEQRSLNLRLAVEGSGATLDSPISWVQVSESADPTTYLEGGELLLTTGLVMPDGTPDAAHREYASRLAEIGARGVGFGSGIQHEHVPQWLIYQCEAVGLPLFTVPLATPFIAISKTIARGISDDTHRNVERMYRNQQRLLRSVHSLDPVSTIISRLAELIGGWFTVVFGREQRSGIQSCAHAPALQHDQAVPGRRIAIGASFRGRRMERAASATVGRIAHYRTAGCVGGCRPAVRAVPTYGGEERQSCGVRHCGRRYVGDRVAIECGDVDAAADPYGSTDRGPILRCDLDRYAPCAT